MRCPACLPAYLCEACLPGLPLPALLPKPDVNSLAALRTTPLCATPSNHPAPCSQGTVKEFEIVAEEVVLVWLGGAAEGEGGGRQALPKKAIPDDQYQASCLHYPWLEAG